MDTFQMGGGCHASLNTQCFFHVLLRQKHTKVDELQHKQKPPRLIQDVAQLQRQLSHIREVMQHCDTALLGGSVRWPELHNTALCPFHNRQEGKRDEVKRREGSSRSFRWSCWTAGRATTRRPLWASAVWRQQQETIKKKNEAPTVDLLTPGDM